MYRCHLISAFFVVSFNAIQSRHDKTKAKSNQTNTTFCLKCWRFRNSFRGNNDSVFDRFKCIEIAPWIPNECLWYMVNECGAFGVKTFLAWITSWSYSRYVRFIAKSHIATRQTNSSIAHWTPTQTNIYLNENNVEWENPTEKYHKPKPML